MQKSHKHICEKCKKTWYRLENGQIINHVCKTCPHPESKVVELEDDNGNKVKACRKCKRIVL